MPDGLSIGAGAARGVKAFLASFQQAKMYKHQEKFQQNQVLVELLSKQLEDPNTTYKDRANILRSIPKLYGIKSEAIDPLMRMLDSANDEDVQTGTKESKTNPEIPQIVGGKPTNVLAPEQQNLVRQTPILQKKGELTPAILRNMLVKKQKDAEDEGDLEKAKKIAQFNFELQEKSYKANGYKITSEGTNSEGEYVQILTNNSGDTKINKLPKGFKPIKLQIAETNINKPSIFVREREDYWESQGFSPEEANIKALNDANDRYKLKTKTGEAFIKGVENRNSGQTPIQPAQKQDDDRANNQIRLNIQKDIDDSQAEANAAKSRMNALEARKELAAKEATDADKAFYATESGVADTEYVRLKTDAEQARIRYNTIEKEYNVAAEDEKLAKGKLSGAKGRLNSLSGNSNIEPKLKRAIDQIRKNNPDKTANMSDDDIIAYLRSKKLIK